MGAVGECRDLLSCRWGVDGWVEEVDGGQWGVDDERDE